MDRRIEMIHEDEHILVCHKYPGIAVESASLSQKDMMGELRRYLKGSELYMIHRLDQPVEGILVFAKDKAAAAALSKAVSDGDMNKIYLAEVYGHALKDSGRLTDYMKKDGSSNCSVITDKNAGGAKEARLEYEVIAEKDETSLLRIKLDTGRHHQIRLQLSNAGAPILGDRKYASAEAKGYSEEQGIKDIRLCACRLKFIHPVNGKESEFRIEPSWCFTYEGVSDKL